MGGQLYMIAKHSSEESKNGEGVEVVENCPIDDAEHGAGQYTEKRIHLSNRLPSWIKSLVPKIFYITEKAWNYYPYTITEYTCSFVPRFAIHIQTKYLNDKGTTDNCLDLSNEMKESRVVEVVDIVNDKVADHHYKESEDLSQFTSSVTGRGPLPSDWLENADPVMCSYKSVEVKLDLWAFQSRIEDVRDYEKKMQKETNERLLQEMENQDTTDATTPTTPSKVHLQKKAGSTGHRATKELPEKPQILHS